MLRKLIANLYRQLPFVRELHDIRASLARAESHTLALKNNEIIRLLDFEWRDHPRYGDPLRLLRHHARVCSQNGEDGMIHEIFRRIGTTNRLFVELGVGDGHENNTAFLLSQGWTGCWIDGDNAFTRTLKSREDLRTGCVKALVAFASRENIASLFQQLNVPVEFDFLSLDIDQNTFYAWEGLGAYRPRVVVVEYNAAIPADIDWKVRYDSNRVWDGSQNYGASLKAFENLGRRFGYSLVGCDFGGLNAFFVRDDLVAGKFAEPFTSENHHERPRYAMLDRGCHFPNILDRVDSGG